VKHITASFCHSQSAVTNVYNHANAHKTPIGLSHSLKQLHITRFSSGNQQTPLQCATVTTSLICKLFQYDNNATQAGWVSCVNTP